MYKVDHSIVVIYVRIMYLLLILLVINLLLLPHNIYSQVSILSINGLIVYDPVYDYGLVTLSLKYSELLNNSIVEIQLIGNTSNILNVTDINGNLLTYTYIRENNTIKVFVNESDTVIIEYSITDLFTEIMINSYMGFVDLTMYKNTAVYIELHINGEYSIDAYPETNSSYENGLTKIILDKPDLYIITLYIIPETPPIPVTTPSPSPSPSQTPTPGVTTPSPTSPTTIAHEEDLRGFALLAILVIIVIIIVLIVIFKLIKK